MGAHICGFCNYEPCICAKVKARRKHNEAPDTRHQIPMTEKPTNPKEIARVRRTPLSPIPAPVIAEVGLAMLEGYKYGRHNYRVSGVRASVYYDAALGHTMDWWEGEDLDPDSNLNHITKAIASLVTLRDGMMTGMWEDDRPPVKHKPGWRRAMHEVAGKILDRIEVKEPYTQKGQETEKATYRPRTVAELAEQDAYWTYRGIKWLVK